MKLAGMNSPPGARAAGTAVAEPVTCLGPAGGWMLVELSPSEPTGAALLADASPADAPSGAAPSAIVARFVPSVSACRTPGLTTGEWPVAAGNSAAAATLAARA